MLRLKVEEDGKDVSVKSYYDAFGSSLQHLMRVVIERRRRWIGRCDKKDLVIHHHHHHHDLIGEYGADDDGDGYFLLITPYVFITRAQVRSL